MKFAYKLIFILLIFFFSWLSFKESMWRFSFSNVFTANPLLTNSEKVTNHQAPRYKAIRWINNNIENTATFLVFRQSDFAYYTKFKMVKHLDPITKPLYISKSIEELKSELKKLNITHAFFPSYDSPLYYNSQLMQLFGDPRHSELLYSENGYRVFKISNKNSSSDIRKVSEENVFKGSSMGCLREDMRKCKKLSLDNEVLNIDFTKPNFSYWIYSPGGYLPFSTHDPSNSIPVSSHLTYQFLFQAQGSGNLNVYVIGFNNGQRFNVEQIWNGVLQKGSIHRIKSQLFFHPLVEDVRIVFQFKGSKQAKISDFFMNSFESKRRISRKMDRSFHTNWKSKSQSFHNDFSDWNVEFNDNVASIQSRVYTKTVPNYYYQAIKNIESGYHRLIIQAIGCGILDVSIYEHQLGRWRTLGIFNLSHSALDSQKIVSTITNKVIPGTYIEAFKDYAKDWLNNLYKETYLKWTQFDIDSNYIVIKHSLGFNKDSSACLPSKVNISHLDLLDKKNQSLLTNPFIVQPD